MVLTLDKIKQENIDIGMIQEPYHAYKSVTVYDSLNAKAKGGGR